MFIQIIQGQVADAEELRAAGERWATELGPGAIGWLGTTSGVTEEGRAIVLARFESADAARRNSERPEQHQWWMETAKLFAGDVTFHDCDDVYTFLGGGSDDARFVQIIQGTTSNPDRTRELLQQSSEPLRQHRPEIIGGVMAMHGGNGFTEAVYFTSESAARAGERKDPPAEYAEQFREFSETLGDATFYDLREPMMQSPK
jgi:hypothetical protein